MQCRSIGLQLGEAHCSWKAQEAEPEPLAFASVTVMVPRPEATEVAVMHACQLEVDVTAPLAKVEAAPPLAVRVMVAVPLWLGVNTTQTVSPTWTVDPQVALFPLIV